MNVRRSAFRAALLAAAAAGALGTVVAATGPALAKAPTGVPSLEEILQKARLAEAEAARKAAEAQRDPTKELIDNYRTKKTELKDYQPIVELILDAKNDAVQPYRAAAVDALMKRFEAEDPDNNAAARKMRLDVAMELTGLLIAPAADDKGLLAADAIFYGWYRQAVVNCGWKRDGKPADRQKAYVKIKKWLKDSKK